MKNKVRKDLTWNVIFFLLLVVSLYFSEDRWGRMSTNFGILFAFIFIFFGEAIFNWLKNRK